MALALGQTVGQLKQTLTNKEYLDWVAYYKSYPFDDFHRFHRPAALLVSRGKNEQLDAALKFLDINSVLPGEINMDEMSEADMSIIQNLR